MSKLYKIINKNAGKSVELLDDVLKRAQNIHFLDDDDNIIFNLITKAQEILIETIEDEDGFLNTCLDEKCTNLPVDVHVYCLKTLHSWPFLKATKSGEKSVTGTALVTISNDPKIIEGKLDSRTFTAIKKWIKLNKKVLLDHWYYMTDSVELFEKVKKV